MRLQRTVETDAPAAKVFGYLRDFTTTNEWDPGTVHTERVSGDGGVGTTYRNRSRFLGRETELTYQTVRLEPDRLVELRGENRSVRVRDSMRIAPRGTGSQVTYTADFDFRGIGGLLAPLLRPALKRLGDAAAQGMAGALARL